MMTVQLIQVCPSLQLLQSFFQNLALNEHGDEWLSLFQFYRKTFFRSVDPSHPKQPINVKPLKLSQKNVKSLKLSQGEVQKFSGEVQNDLRGDAHLKIRPCMTVMISSVFSYMLPNFFFVDNFKLVS
jgi:hypothetical protein